VVKIFNEKEIGAKIRSERNLLGDSLESFAEKVNISRQTLSKWENGNGAGPTVNDLIRICEVLGCDFGYLVGEYSCRKREATDIQAEIGLTESAISTLRTLNTQSKRFINDLLLNPSALEALAYSYCLCRDSLQYYSGKNGMGLTNFSGKVNYCRADGQSMTVPLPEMHQYNRFEFLHEIQNFADRDGNEKKA